MTLHRCFLMWSPTGMPVAPFVPPVVRNPEQRPPAKACPEPCRRAGACVEGLKANAMFDRPVFLS